MNTLNLSNVPHIKFNPHHSRTPSRSPTRSPTRQRITEDILSDLSPATTLEAFTSANPSGKLRASVEAATPSERAFGIRATLASKKIQEWVEELSAWPWPKGAGAEGFEIPAAKRQKLNRSDSRRSRNGHPENEEIVADASYMGSLPTEDVMAYEIRLDEIQEDMDDLDVEGIKSNVLHTHTSSKSWPASPQASNTDRSPRASFGSVEPFPPTSLATYTKMDDFTAIVTATVLQSLPYLSRLNKLMDVWSIRFIVLRKVPPVLEMLQDTEIALRSGWEAIHLKTIDDGEEQYLDRMSFDTMRNVLQDKLLTLGQELDFMLDTLEGREDTLPERWLDRMEKIESDYGEWVVRADRKVWEGEWAAMAKEREQEEKKLETLHAARKGRQEAEQLRQDAEDKLRTDEAENEAEKLKEIQAQQEERDKLRAEQIAAEVARLDAERARQQEDAHSKEEEEQKLKLEQAVQEATRVKEVQIRQEEADRLRAEQEAAALATLEMERAKKEEERQLRFEVDEAQRIKEHEHKMQAEEARVKADEAHKAREAALKLEQEEAAEAARIEDERAREVLEDEMRRSRINAKAAEAATRDAQRAAEAEREATRISLDDYVCPDPDHKQVGMLKSRGKISKVFKGAAAGLAGLKRAVRKRRTDGADDDESENEDEDLPTTLDSRPSNLDGHSDSKVDPAGFGLPKDFNTDRSRSRSRSPRKNRRSRHPDYLQPLPMTNPTDHQSTVIACPPAALIGPAEPAPLQRVSGDPMDEPAPKPSVAIEDTLTARLMKDTPQESELPPVELFDHPEKPEVEVTTSPATAEPEEQIMQPAIPVPEEAATMTPPSIADHSDPFSTQQSVTDSLEIPESASRHESGGHSRNLSIVSGYSTSDPSPELHQAEPAEYFRPGLSPIKSVRSFEIVSAPQTPTMPSRSESDAMPLDGLPAKSFEDEPLIPIHFQDSDTEAPVPEHDIAHSGDGNTESRIHSLGDLAIDYIDPSKFPGNASVGNSISRPSSSASNRSVIITRQIVDTVTFEVPVSPLSTTDAPESFPDLESPSAGRTGNRVTAAYNQSPPGSPTIPAISKLRLLDSPNLIPSSPLVTPITPTSDTPSFPSLDISPAPLSSPKKSSTDDQIQVQISTLLESITTARIRLTSEPDTEANHPSSTNSDTLRPKKTRRSLTPSLRSSSSMSMRAPTPSFTLAPAYSKSTPRPRHQVSNPEIKLYHLSRSTGEAPIKLFVRLVGENGERVMVRVGGGWADLGEYLREYASHHGRRVVSGKTEDDKVEIQDLPSRTVSSTKGSNNSSNGRASPLPQRPNSVLERERPMSSLYIRKTRKSIGEQSDSAGTVQIAPSTPMQFPSSPPRHETPPSVPGRSVSRLSWTEEEGGLGLAGPKSKPKVISERDQEWVESMKEKVRAASAEKERKFGELERVGGTKRLFKKSA